MSPTKAPPVTSATRQSTATGKSGVEKSLRHTPMFTPFPNSPPRVVRKVRVKGPRKTATQNAAIATACPTSGTTALKHSAKAKKAKKAKEVKKVWDPSSEITNSNTNLKRKTAKPYDEKNLLAYSAATKKRLNEVNVIFGLKGTKDIVVFGERISQRRTAPM
ncbi:hypothetical protein N7470_008249 [Penicillium chermesinum]|nr:hypothetical protein N7470_008249 [Penicillium chermesinum]